MDRQDAQPNRGRYSRSSTDALDPGRRDRGRPENARVDARDGGKPRIPPRDRQGGDRSDGENRVPRGQRLPRDSRDGHQGSYQGKDRGRRRDNLVRHSRNREDSRSRGGSSRPENEDKSRGAQLKMTVETQGFEPQRKVQMPKRRFEIRKRSDISKKPPQGGRRGRADHSDDTKLAEMVKSRAYLIEDEESAQGKKVLQRPQRNPRRENAVEPPRIDRDRARPSGKNNDPAQTPPARDMTRGITRNPSKKVVKLSHVKSTRASAKSWELPARGEANKFRPKPKTIAVNPTPNVSQSTKQESEGEKKILAIRKRRLLTIDRNPIVPPITQQRKRTRFSPRDGIAVTKTLKVEKERAAGDTRSPQVPKPKRKHRRIVAFDSQPVEQNFEQEVVITMSDPAPADTEA